MYSVLSFAVGVLFMCACVSASFATNSKHVANFL